MIQPPAGQFAPPEATRVVPEPDRIVSAARLPDRAMLGGSGASTLRWRLLLTLREYGPASPDQLAARLRASRTGILQQLRALRATGLVDLESVRHGVGRPRHLYDLTSGAQELFPASYDGLAIDLLAALRELGGPGLVEDVFRARRCQLGDRMRERIAGTVPAEQPFVERVRELARIQDELGYVCRVVIEGGGSSIRLFEHNCAISRVAAGHAIACEEEVRLFSEVLGAVVIRESHIRAGDRCCSYRIEETRPS